MKVELYVYSGCPNPTWELPDDDSIRLLDIIGEIPYNNPVDYDIPEGLGYCGINVSTIKPDRPRTKIMVYHELVMLSSEGYSRQFTDSKRSVENFLLDTAKPYVSDALLNRIRLEGIHSSIAKN